ncbi:MAG: sigma-70 family RNA polymerase sigma factor [Phycisphaerales bacterium]|jgi:RNA polymerase sigma-70 factor (ECF subfamily)|nr:sigma-70 family RNA polymerase sigma factor [Phycisphaerales bacterium]
MNTPEHPNKILFNQIHGKKLPQIIAIPHDNVVLGRGPDCSFQLTNKYVSRKHAQLAFQKDCWVLQDLKSRSGTYLNTIRMESGEEVQLHNDDLVQIGPWKFLVRIGDQDVSLDNEMVEELDKANLVEKGDDVPTLVRTVNGRYETNMDLLLQLKSDETVNREMGWGIFVDRYGPIICGFARNAGLPSGEADDIMQTVLFNFFKVADRFEYDPSKGRFRGYLKRITLNAIRQRYRKKREKNLDTHGMNVAEDHRDDLDAVFDREWAEHLLSEAMTEARPKFEPKTWEAFELYGRRGMSAQRTAERLDMTPESVRHAKSRVMRAVREVVIRLREEEL